MLINKLSKVQKNIVMHEKAYECIASLVGRISGKISATRKESRMYRSELEMNEKRYKANRKKITGEQIVRGQRDPPMGKSRVFCSTTALVEKS